MRIVKQHRLVSALRNYLTHLDSAVDARAIANARRELLSTVPQKSKWFFCEVDGQDYAVRVSKDSRIEIMHNIFNGFRSASHPRP